MMAEMAGHCIGVVVRKLGVEPRMQGRGKLRICGSARQLCTAANGPVVDGNLARRGGFDLGKSSPSVGRGYATGPKSCP